MAPLIIAIDGPAAAGKGTLARRLADHLGLAYLDTGRIYRAVAAIVLEAGGDPSDLDRCLAVAGQLELADLERPGLRDERVGEAASKLAAMSPVRESLLAMQRRVGRNPPAGLGGVVLDGRDIGTVVFPDAPVKVYLVASEEERARRRHKELLDQGTPRIYGEVLADVIARDERDSRRMAAPLRPAEDALVLDTTDLDADAAFAKVVAYVGEVVGIGTEGGRST